MARRAAGDPAFDARFEVRCYRSDLDRWAEIAKAAGMKLADYIRSRMPKEAPESTARRERGTKR